MEKMPKIFDFSDYREAIEEFAPCMDDYPYVLDLKNDIYYISERAVGRFNVPGSFFENANAAHKEFVHVEDYDMLMDDLGQMLAGVKDEHNIRYRWLDVNKEPVWINCRGRLVRDVNNDPSFLVGCINEIGLMSEADNISGLLQSVHLREAFDEKTGIRPKFVLRIGIDGFKNINEKFGLEYGNFVLKGVAGCILASVNDKQKTFHVVSDEYMVADYSSKSVEELHDLYDSIRHALDIFIEENSYEAVYTISGGILACDEEEVSSYDKLMKLSQFALSEAKNRGKNQVYIFDNNDYVKFLRRREILTALRKSVANDFQGFDLHFQPIMTAGEANEAKIYAAESLLRFETTKGERLSPFEFVPILEDSGLIIPVGRWILDKAASMCSECQRYIPDFKVSVNLSYIQILKSSITDSVIEVIERYGIKPESIIVEMTESGYLEDTPSVSKVWTNLKDYGVLIAIDDFGTGYSNLSSISNLTPDIVKLDRGFTVKALKNFYENLLMSHIIQLVHSIDLKICIEGVETEDELRKLNLMDPNYIQGYFYSKPCSRSEFLKNFIYEK